MTSLLDIMDRSGTTVQFALHDPTGASSAEYGGVTSDLLGDVNWGSPTRTLERYPYTQGGGTTLRNVGTFTPSSFKVRIHGSSYDNLNKAVGRLSALLAEGGVMRWLPDGSTTTRYVDYEPSETPAVLDGRALGLYEALRLFDTPKGVTIALLRQPYMRGAELDSTTNLLTNATLLRDVALNGTPDLWAWDSTTNITGQTISTAQQAYGFAISTTGTRNFQQTSANDSMTGSADYVLSAEAKVASGTARLTLGWQGKNNAGTNQGSEVVSTQTTLTTGWQRISAAGTANGSATKALVSLRMANAAATSVTVYLRNVKLEQATTATPFVVGSETMDNDPAASFGRTVHFWNPGDAPTPVTVRIGASGAETDGPHFAVVGVRSAGPITGTNDLVDYANTRYFMQAEAMDNGTGTSALSLAGFSGGSGKTTVFTDNTFATRISDTLTTSLDGLRGGRWQVIARVSTTATSSSYTLGLRHGFGSGTVSARDNATATLATLDVYEVPLGVISVPADADAVFIGVAVTRESGAGTLRWDFLTLIPADTWALIGDADHDFAGLLLESDPSLPRVGITAADGDVAAVVASRGPLPFIAPPGASVVYVSVGQTQEPNMTTEFGAREVGFICSPRYFT